MVALARTKQQIETVKVVVCLYAMHNAKKIIKSTVGLKSGTEAPSTIPLCNTWLGSCILNLNSKESNLLARYYNNEHI